MNGITAETDNVFVQEETAFDSTNQSEFIECKIFNGDAWKCEIVVTVKRVAASLSILGCIFTVFLIIFLKKYVESSQRMIVNLSIAAMLLSTFTLVDDFAYEADTLCIIQGAFLTLFVWNCCLWIMTIVFNLYLRLVFNIDITKREKELTVFNWVFPIVPALLPFVSDMYGPAGVWCWIINNWRWRLGDWYFFRISSLLIFIVVMIHMTVVMYKMRANTVSSKAARKTMNDDIRTLRVYPIVYFLVNLFPIVNRVQNAISGADQSGYIFPFLLIQAMSDPSFGAAIAVAYVLDSRTRKRLTIKHFKKASEMWKQNATKIQEFSLSGTAST